MPITKGQLLFALIFFICFIVVMFFLYRSDRKVNRTYYKGVYVVLIAMVLFVALYNLAMHFINHG